jgi:hypothetical protein
MAVPHVLVEGGKVISTYVTKAAARTAGRALRSAGRAVFMFSRLAYEQYVAPRVGANSNGKTGGPMAIGARLQQQLNNQKKAAKKSAAKKPAKKAAKAAPKKRGLKNPAKVMSKAPKGSTGLKRGAGKGKSSGLKGRTLKGSSGG